MITDANQANIIPKNNDAFAHIKNPRKTSDFDK